MRVERELVQRFIKLDRQLQVLTQPFFGRNMTEVQMQPDKPVRFVMLKTMQCLRAGNLSRRVRQTDTQMRPDASAPYDSGGFSIQDGYSESGRTVLLLPNMTV
jgi:hypothetical protein